MKYAISNIYLVLSKSSGSSQSLSGAKNLLNDAEGWQANESRDLL